MRIYIGFDDTDNITADRGTGKLARWFENELPEDCRMEGIVRQQLLVDERIPYTSHNSSACVMVDAPDASWVALMTARAIEHVKRHSLEGSDPGLCVASESDAALPRLIAFGRACTSRILTQKEALEAASRSHLSGHGGSNDGIIGAAAAVGLTASGWSGRFIEYGRLRKFSDPVRVLELERSNIVVVSGDRDARVPGPKDIVYTKGWLRPRLWGKRVVLLVTPKDEGVWESIGERRNKEKGGMPTYLAS
jgi:tRNA(Ile2) C34 agmatinyltransferase TiaS